MKYLIDAQLPRRVKNWLVEFGVEAIHTLDLPKQNATPDSEIIEIHAAVNVIVVSKDKDFPQQRIIRGRPEKLLWITTGNISNNELIKLFELNFKYINDSFIQGSKFIEMDNLSVIIHE